MKLILLAAAALLACAGDATAAKLQNKAVLGAWCTMAAEPNAQGPEIYYPLGLGEECGDGILRIKPDRYEEVESGCRYTEVKTWFDPTIPVATKTKLGAYVSRVTAQCTGEGDKWREEATFYFSKGMLYFSRKQTR
jgi:hypothetical protein